MKRFDWIFAILKLNWANITANRTMFWSMTLLMCAQNFIYFSLWAILFGRISSLGGWGLSEVAFLFASGALGYGMLFTIFGGINQMGATIQNGELDICLARPRSALLLVLLQRMRADSLGDVITGLIMLAFFVRPALSDIPLIIVLSLSAGLVFASVRIIAHAITFWGAEGETGENGFTAFLIAATNPQKGFGSWGKLALLTIFPAGYVGLLPVEILRDFRWDYMALQLFGSAAILLLAIWIFERGLKRYKSGNKFLMLR